MSMREMRPSADFVWKDQTDLLWGALSSGGAFLVVLDPHGKPNPMTIGWGQIGIVWSRPVFTVLVRQNRYTYECLRAAESFTVSVPGPGALKDALFLCGTKSGRSLDKFRAAGLTAAPARVIETPIVAECVAHYECRALAHPLVAMDDITAADVIDRFSYVAGNTHAVFFGEIVATYATPGVLR
jgi:flavin reductase (DIM6/NTAB) family NADH-FMN oxidoreductase RutF